MTYIYKINELLTQRKRDKEEKKYMEGERDMGRGWKKQTKNYSRKINCFHLTIVIYSYLFSVNGFYGVAC